LIAQIIHKGDFVNHSLTISAANIAAGADAVWRLKRGVEEMKGILLAVAAVGLGTMAYITIGIALASVG
jgi:hypothetical protein